MRAFTLVLLAVIVIGVAGRLVYNFVADDLAWHTNKAVQLSVLHHAETHLTGAKIFQSFPTKEEGNTLATIIVTDINQSAEDEVVSAKQALDAAKSTAQSSSN